MDVFEITQVTDEIVEAFERLIPQLSSSNPPPTRAELEEMVASRASILLGARDPENGNRLVGSLTLAVFRVPTGVRAWIEDVVVDQRFRGQGIGHSAVGAQVHFATIKGKRRGKVARLIRRVEMDMDAGMRGAKVAEDRRQHGHSEDFHRR